MPRIRVAACRGEPPGTPRVRSATCSGKPRVAGRTALGMDPGRATCPGAHSHLPWAHLSVTPAQVTWSTLVSISPTYMIMELIK